MIKPYVHPRPHRELALALAPDHVLTETGVYVRLRDALARGVQVWAPGESLRAWTKAGQGSAVLWRFAAIGWHPDRDAADWPVRGLQLELPDDAHETLAGLIRWRDWLESYGAAPAGSLGGSGMSLLKATLERDLWTARGDLPPIRYTLGGRQETPPPTPRVEQGRLRHCDIAAAYASTLGRVRYGGIWARLPWAPVWRERLEANPDLLAYARAVVDVPEELELGPLPVRPRSPVQGAAALFWAIREDAYPVGRNIQGTWSWPELMAAEAAGCKIRRVLDLWVHGAEWRPFAPWYAAVWEGRELGGFAGRLAKATGNATWGQFAIAKGQKKVVARGRDEDVGLRGGNPSQRAFDLSEWIAGTVRSQLYEGIAHVGGDLIAAHTDGLWTRGRLVPGWRVKKDRDADELRLIDAQHLSHRRGEGPWEYVVAGVLDPAEWFEQTWSRFEARGRVHAA